MSTEVVVLPEMEVAGAQALDEARSNGLDDVEQAVAVYMAMRAVFCLSVLADRSKEIH